MKFALYWTFTFLIMFGVDCEMSENQLKAATKMIKNVCLPKTKVPPALISAMHKGDFQEDRALMCFMECSLRLGKLTNKEGKFDVPAALAQVPTLPEVRQQPTIESTNACKDAGSTAADKCQAAFQIYKCLYEYNPQTTKNYKNLKTFANYEVLSCTCLLL